MIALSLVAVAGATPPPIIAFGPGGEQSPRILMAQPGEVRCGGALVRPLRAERPLPIEVSYYPESQAPQLTLRLNFRIDASGRPLSISQPVSATTLAGQVRDLVPAFAAWRFSPGAARESCAVTFAAEVVPAASAPLAAIRRLLILGQASARFREAVAARVQGAGSTCFNPPPAVRQRVYPAFEQIAQAPGTASYSLTSFDIDASGRPTNVRLADSDGNPQLDRQSVDAVRRSRFAPEARQGCSYPYWRRATETIAAPLIPDLERYRRPGDTCRPEGAQWAHLPELVFPPEFLPRAIEGWAILRYDVAPWGATGNVSVVAAEPAARFGTQAESIVRDARAQPSSTGATGCIDRVIFRLPAGRERRPVPQPSG